MEVLRLFNQALPQLTAGPADRSPSGAEAVKGDYAAASGPFCPTAAQNAIPHCIVLRCLTEVEVGLAIRPLLTLPAITT